MVLSLPNPDVTDETGGSPDGDNEPVVVDETYADPDQPVDPDFIHIVIVDLPPVPRAGFRSGDPEMPPNPIAPPVQAQALQVEDAVMRAVERREARRSLEVLDGVQVPSLDVVLDVGELLHGAPTQDLAPVVVAIEKLLNDPVTGRPRYMNSYGLRELQEITQETLAECRGMRTVSNAVRDFILEIRREQHRVSLLLSDIDSQLSDLHERSEIARALRPSDAIRLSKFEEARRQTQASEHSLHDQYLELQQRQQIISYFLDGIKDTILA